MVADIKDRFAGEEVEGARADYEAGFGVREILWVADMVVMDVGEKYVVDVGGGQATFGEGGDGVRLCGEGVSGGKVFLEFLGVESDVSSYAEIEDEAGCFAVGGLVLDEEGHGRNCLLCFLVGRRDEEAFRQGKVPGA